MDSNVAKVETISSLKLISSHGEVGNVQTFVFETGGITWLAGQAQAYRLPQLGSDEKESVRWFTISSSPSEGNIHISTRVSQSKFKQALAAMEPGNEIQAHGLEGDFTWEESAGEPVVLVAGGIGITPFRSILVSRQAEGKRLNATLLYFNRDEDVAFKAELEALREKHSDLHLEVIIGEDVSAQSILKHAPQAAKQLVYISGAEPMVEKVGADLSKLGVRIKQDCFPGYDEKNY